jgi:hypothetical protein
MLAILAAVVAPATIALLVLHVVLSFNGTYERWAAQADADTVSKRTTTTTERNAP